MFDALSQANSQDFVLQFHGQSFVRVKFTLTHVEEEFVQFGVRVVYVILDPLQEWVTLHAIFLLLHLSDTIAKHYPFEGLLGVRLDNKLLMLT